MDAAQQQQHLFPTQRLAKTKITSGKSSKGKVNLKWQKVNGAAGYVVYRSTKKGSRYTKIAEITKGSTKIYR